MDDEYGEPWASKLYLIPESDYDILIKEKHKEEQASYPQVPASSQETSAPSQGAPPPPQGTSLPQEETGEGKRYSELDIKKFNRDFLTKQNLERFLENEKWNKIFERIKPYLENNSEKKSSPLVTFEQDRDLLVPAPKPLSRSEQILRRNVTIQPTLEPTRTHTARAAEVIRDKRNELQEREAVEARAKEAVEATARKDKALEKAFEISPIPPSEHRARQANYVRNLFETTPPRNNPPALDGRRRSREVVNQGASPFPPADSTRNKKKKRNQIKEEPSSDDDDPYAHVEGARGGPSGRGFKKFKKWEKF